MTNLNFKENIFGVKSKLDPEAHVIVVADLFVEDYVGGAELTTEALINTSTLKIQKVRSRDVNIEMLREGVSKFWVFGNFAGLNPQLLPTIIGNLKYTVLEYDYKYCKYRSPEKHLSVTKSSCDCHEQMNGKLVSAFYYGATCLWWMSEAQKEKYHSIFPFLAEKSNIVLSSVFSRETLGRIKFLREKFKNEEKKGWIVLGSDSWIKGADAAKNWCEENNKDYEVVWGLSYEELLAKLSVSEGFVYLPLGKDTCPRMVIEAKLLGCNLHLNENVQHKDEEWFNTDNLDEIEEYLYAAPDLFWNAIRTIISYKPKISGYTTVYNAESQGYPFVETVKSMLGFCDEVCVLDGGSTDNTYSILQELAKNDDRIKLSVHRINFESPDYARESDGMQKARARDLCTGEFCWQMDCDEVVHEEDYEKIIDLCKKFPNGIDLVCLPVVEYWGGPNKVRADIMPWKWRLSRNKKNITHGVPRDASLLGENNLISSDGCDIVDRETNERIQSINFYNAQIDTIRRMAVSGNAEALSKYETWYNAVSENIPTVYHYSWYDMERKIRLYKNYWSKFWINLVGKQYEDTAENNMMFDVPWHQVTDEMIKERAKEFSDKLGGWIWHRKWDGATITHSVNIKRSQPKIMLEKK
jgi:glycosyltransferase involved in cell wall biosynthesis